MEIEKNLNENKNVYILNKKYPILNYLLSQLRDKNTKAAEFRMYSNRVMNILIEEAIS
jgi:uracil phosphoribosyltransferase